MARTTQQLREAYAPACSERERQGAQDAWSAFDACLRWAHYEVRVADTAFRSCRPITGGVGYSLHAYFIEGVIRFWNWARDGLTRVVGIGVAVDINWRSNPYGPVLVTDMPRPMVEAILAIRTIDGVPVFRWGGYYRGNKDAMHYEFIAVPAELARGIDWDTVVGSAVTPGPHPVPPVQSDQEEEEDMRPVVMTKAGGGGPGWLVLQTGTGKGLLRFELGDPGDVALPPAGYGPVVEVAEADLNAIPIGRDA